MARSVASSGVWRGSLAAMAAFAAVGSLVGASDVVEGYPFAPGQAVRYALAALLLLAIARFRLPRLARREALGLAALAATGLMLFNVLVIAAVRETDPATVGVIVGCVPVVLALAGPLVIGRRITGRVVVAGVIVSVGAAGVQYADGGITAAGLALALGALACEDAFSLFAVPHLSRLGALAVSTYACLFALPMLAVWSLVTVGPAPPLPEPDEAMALAYLGVVVTSGGFVTWYYAVGTLGVERAGLFSGVLPISALACSAVLGVAAFTPERLLAVTVVAAGITLGVVARSPVRWEASGAGPAPAPRPAGRVAAGR